MGKQTKQTQNSSTRRPRSKTTWLLLLLAAVVVLSLTLYLVLHHLEEMDSASSESDISSETSGGTITQEILDSGKDADEIESMQVENEYGSYVIASTMQDGERDYFVEGFDGVPVYDMLVKYSVQNAWNFVVSQELGAVENPGDYGFDDPTATITFTFSDGSTYAYAVGSAYSHSSDEEEQYYLRFEGSDQVYLCSVTPALLSDKTLFLSTVILSLDSEEAGNTVETLHLSGRQFSRPVEIELQNGEYRMLQPVEADCDQAELNLIATQLITLGANQAVCVFPDAEALADYGLDEPDVVVEFTLQSGEQHRFAVSKKDSETYYLQADDVDAVYEVAVDSVESWSKCTAFTLREKAVVHFTKEEAQALTLQLQEQTVELTVSREVDEFLSTEDQPAYTYSAVAQNGKTVDTSEYNLLWTRLEALQLLAENSNSPDGALLLRIVCDKFDDQGQSTLEFYEKGEGRCLAVVDGVTAGVLDREDVDQLLAVIEDFT